MRDDIERIKKYVRAANYLTVAQIFLNDNFLLQRPLTFNDIKTRLLGHWGTCPGINFVYAQLNYFIKKHRAEILFVLGPGHGFPALQANLFLEGTLVKYYPEATRDASGIAYLAKNFSWPYGFPSHTNPGTPGAILEGGELGYALAVSYGAALDNPNLLVTCLIGDGEAETGPTATAWHLAKFINPKTNGAVLPILHLNGYKISGPTIFGRMSNQDLIRLFEGYGYEPLIVEGNQIYEKMMRALEKAYGQINKRKKNHRLRPPMIILKTLKGWTGPKTLRGSKIEGNHLSHQVVLTQAKTDPEELKILENWLRSYRFEELFDSQKGFDRDILDLIPDDRWKMGENKYAHGLMRKELILPDPNLFAEDATTPGTIGSSSMRRAGLYLKEVFALNRRYKNFRLFSPDETYSNKLDDVFKETSRAWAMPFKSWDRDLALDGRVMEMLSEHSLQGLIQGYILTGRHGVFASYEAFIQIVSSMADQYAKFLKQAMEIPWRQPISSLNYILTSSGWRQEHNGFSHQNPGFIGDLLEKPGCFINVYFPPDGNSTLVVLDHCLRSTNMINIIVAGKTLEPRWLTVEKAREELERGMMVWDFASDENPDLVIAGIGDYMTKEALAAISLLKQAVPEIRIRFVNILELSTLGLGNSACRLPRSDFKDYFTNDKPVIVNFHGYPDTIKPVFMNQDNPRRFFIHGYIENGSTTTPFDMQVRNGTDRFHLAIEALRILGKAQHLIPKFEAKLKEHTEYIKQYGVDLEEIEKWQWLP